jgi:hypothetical protein
MTPDLTPLLLFSGLAPHRERCEGAEGNHIVGEERARAREIHRLNTDLELLKPAADQSDIIILFSHDSLQGLRLGDRMVRVPPQSVKPPAGSTVCPELAG